MQRLHTRYESQGGMRVRSGEISVRACGTAALMAFLLTGCGQTGIPLPPSLNLPAPVTDLSANRNANVVHLQWTMPRHTTDGIVLKQTAAPVHVCRRLQNGPCVSVGDARFAPDKPAGYDDALPPELASGAPRLLAYTVEVRNGRGRDAGRSNIAYAAAGTTPPPLQNFTGEIRADGVLLQWQPAPNLDHPETIQIHRTLLSLAPASKAQSGAKSSGMDKSQPPADQMLAVAVAANSDPGRALDADAAFDQTYRYQASRTFSVDLSGHALEVQSAPSAEITLNTRDVFPPKVPADLAAVAVTEEGAIDLSWTPDSEADLASYCVYRREAGSSKTPERISAATPPLTAPAFRDTTAKDGVAYAYSVSAIDRSGNESGRSEEVTATLSSAP